MNKVLVKEKLHKMWAPIHAPDVAKYVKFAKLTIKIARKILKYLEI